MRRPLWACLCSTGSVTVHATWQCSPMRPAFKAQTGRIIWIRFIAACAFRLKSRADTEGLTMSS